MWSTLVSWLNIWFGARRDGWAAQAAAESGKGGGGEVIGKILLWSLVGALTIAAGTWFWVEKAGAQLQQTARETGRRQRFECVNHPELTVFGRPQNGNAPPPRSQYFRQIGWNDIST